MQNTRLLALNICALFYEIYVDMVTKPVSFPQVRCTGGEAVMVRR